MKTFKLLFVLTLAFTLMQQVKATGPYGCTKTQGYWQTHSKYGPVTRDDTWGKLKSGGVELGINGEDKDFFLSGQSYFEVLTTQPKGNAYYILSHQFIAARLNFLTGASLNDAWLPFEEAEDLLQAYSPDDIAKPKTKEEKELRAHFVYLADILDRYNNGLVGPVHCDKLESKSGVIETPVNNQKVTLSIQNSPNPIKSFTTFSLSLSEASPVKLSILNLSGQEVDIVLNGTYPAGKHQVNWQVPQKLSNGFYLYHLQAGESSIMNKMMISK